MARTAKQRMMAAIAGASAIALVLSACGSSDSGDADGADTPSAAQSDEPSDDGATEGTPTGDEGDDAPTAEPSGDPAAGDEDTWCDEINANWPDITGSSVTIYTSITGVEADQLRDSWTDFADCTGAEIKLDGDKSFEQQVVVKVRSGNPPDLAFVPQPGLLETLVSTGSVATAPAQVEANTEKYWDAGWKQYGTVNGQFYAAPLGANVKSLVWYSPQAFVEKGYEVPQTWDEMIALSDQIVADGAMPWCAGIESGEATGWPATDWLEEVMLRSAGPDAYDKWVAGELKFTDPEVKEALAIVGGILKNPAYVNAGLGDVSSIATTGFAQAGEPILTGDCYLMQMASFYVWPDGTDISEDGEIFAFYEPAMSDEFGKPVEVGGEFVTAFNDKPATQAVQYYLTTAHWANNQSKAASSRISANKGLLIDSVQGPINRLSVEILQDPDAVSRFDASDLMPAAVGAGAMWSQLTAWITGQDDETTLQAIQDAWPN